MTRIEQLEQKVKRLEQKICCKTQFFDTVDDLPEEGNTGVIYVTDNGNIYVWDGSDYILNGLGDAYYTNSYVERLKALGSNVQYSTYAGFSTQNIPLTDGLLSLNSIYIDKTTTITGVGWVQVTQGNYTASDYNGIGLYSYDLLNQKLILVESTTNDGDIWKASANSYATKNFSNSVTINKGLYYIGTLYNNSAQVTAPTVIAAGTFLQHPSIMNAASISSGYLSGSVTSSTVLPAEILNTTISNAIHTTALYIY